MKSSSPEGARFTSVQSPTSNGSRRFNVQRSTFNVETTIVIARSIELDEGDAAISRPLLDSIPVNEVKAASRPFVMPRHNSLKHAKAAKKNVISPKEVDFTGMKGIKGIKKQVQRSTFNVGSWMILRITNHESLITALYNRDEGDRRDRLRIPI